MKKIVKEERTLPIEIGKTYITKLQTKDKFTVTQLVVKHNKNNGKTTTMMKGIWENAPHLGECPLDVERLIPEKEFTGKEYQVTVCPNCEHEIND